MPGSSLAHSASTGLRCLRAAPVLPAGHLPDPFIPLGFHLQALMPHLRAFSQPRSSRGQLDLCSFPWPHGALMGQMPLPCLLHRLRAAPWRPKLYMTSNRHSINYLVREWNIQMTQNSHRLTPETIQESDPKAGCRECLPLPHHPSSEKGRGQGKVLWASWAGETQPHLLSSPIS